MSDAGSRPPSPTPSISTPATTLQLRDNKPEATTGLTSLGLIKDETGTERRRSSIASVNTERDGETFSKKWTKDAPTDDQDGRKQSKGGKEEDEFTHQLEFAQDESINPAPFRFKPFQLSHMLDPKDLGTLSALGGMDGIISGLITHPEHGLRTTSFLAAGEQAQDFHGGASSSHISRQQAESSQSPNIVLTHLSGKDGDNDVPHTGTIDDRKRVYGVNVLPARTTKTLWQLAAAALTDKVLVLLLITAVVSLALGLSQKFHMPRAGDNLPVAWVEGVAIIVAIAILVIVGSLNDWQRERQFKALDERKGQRGVKVIRNGVATVIDIKEVVVGDIALVEPGEIVPCDGIFIAGHNVKCDESGSTGESDPVKKLPYADIVELTRSGAGSPRADCFMISGSKVLEGVGKYVVIAVGQKSFNGQIMMALRSDSESSPLQIKLNNLVEFIAKVGPIAGLAFFMALTIKYFAHFGTHRSSRTPSEWAIEFVNNLILSVTLVVVAVPEGLALVVTLAMGFATKRMIDDNLLVRVLGSCETMANSSVVCTHTTGTLTQNVMTVVAGSVGIHAKFVRSLDENISRTNADEIECSSTESESKRRHPFDFSIDHTKLNMVLSTELQELFNEAISINSTAFEDEDPETGKKIFVGSKTEAALLQFAKELDWRDARETREAADIVQMVPFSSERKAMAVVIKKSQGQHRAYFKGASEILAKRLTRYIAVRQDNSTSYGIETKNIDELSRENISRTIIFYANQMLRTIAIGYRDFETWPPPGTVVDETGDVPFDDLAKDLTLIAITGIEHNLREGAREAVVSCQRAGVSVKMCTGDNALTARSIATQCGIFTPGGIIMEGPAFRQLSDTGRLEIVPSLQVLARSSPEDMKILVGTLKKIGEFVGVVGGANSSPALRTANVGFSMGIAGTEVTREASDIILMDDNFASIVKAIMWGRCVNDNVRKFLQFQISTNITAVTITFVSALANYPALTAVQLLWINIIMDTFAALALATDPASEQLLGRRPNKRTAPLFSVGMYKMILLQSIYQIAIILIFHFLGLKILGLDHSKESEAIVRTLVFNAFVFAQIFNSVNCRRLDSQFNVFEGILKNRYFLVIFVIEIAIQIIIIFVGGAAFHVTRIAGREWGISLAIGFVSIPLGAIIRLLPTKPFESFFKFTRLVRDEQLLPIVKPGREGWGGASDLVRDNLSIFANIRGGRLRSSSYVLMSRRARLPQDDQLSIPLMVMVPTLVMGAVAAGRQYEGSPSDPANADPSSSSAALWEGKVQIHPDTSRDDPNYKRFGNR